MAKLDPESSDHDSFTEDPEWADEYEGGKTSGSADVKSRKKKKKSKKRPKIDQIVGKVKSLRKKKLREK